MDHGLLITDTWVMENAISQFAGVVVRGLDRASFFTRNKLMDITRAGWREVLSRSEAFLRSQVPDK